MKLWHRWVVGAAAALALGASWHLDAEHPDTDLLVAQAKAAAIEQAPASLAESQP